MNLRALIRSRSLSHLNIDMPTAYAFQLKHHYEDLCQRKSNNLIWQNDIPQQIFIERMPICLLESLKRSEGLYFNRLFLIIVIK